MDHNQYLKNLTPPEEKIDVVLDTDAYNEIDDQYAIGYMLRCPEKFNIKGFCAAPFFNSNSTSPEDGMKRSYDELFKLLRLAGEEQYKDVVFEGSRTYLPDENTPVQSPAADFMAELSNNYSPEHPLYIVAIGAITNVASAILKNPAMKENCVFVWLGGHRLDIPKGAGEFNMRQDIAAARVIFGSGAPVVQLPCQGVVDAFATGRWELEHFLKGRNDLCDYLVEHTVEAAEGYAAGKPWTRVIWDVTAVAWLMNGEDRFMRSRLVPAPIPCYDQEYARNEDRHLVRYVYRIHRDKLFEDLFNKLAK